MKIKNEIFLPGGARQLELLRQNLDPEGLTILILGSGAEEIAEDMAKIHKCRIFMITEDNDSLLSARLRLSAYPDVSVRLMDYHLTDFRDGQFDLVYSQGAVSALNRNKIVKEIRRILKPHGRLCVGEIVSLTENPPRFVKDVWERAGLLPMFIEQVAGYYEERKFKIIAEEDLSTSLFRFYRMCEFLTLNKTAGISEDEKKYYKTILNRISHEANVFLKQGGDKHIGFDALLMEKED